LGSGYKIVDHTADLGLRVWGKTVPELFDEAARALMSQIINLEEVESTHKQSFYIEAESIEMLLHQWLREILFYVDKGLVFKQFHIEKHNLSDKNAAKYYIKGQLVGELLDPTRHRICNEIKAVTRHNFYVKSKGPWWEANILLDL
jgi:SHS2 domain-containing protein